MKAVQSPYERWLNALVKAGGKISSSRAPNLHMLDLDETCVRGGFDPDEMRGLAQQAEAPGQPFPAALAHKIPEDILIALRELQAQGDLLFIASFNFSSTEDVFRLLKLRASYQLTDNGYQRMAESAETLFPEQHIINFYDCFDDLDKHIRYAKNRHIVMAFLAYLETQITTPWNDSFEFKQTLATRILEVWIQANEQTPEEEQITLSHAEKAIADLFMLFVKKGKIRFYDDDVDNIEQAEAVLKLTGTTIHWVDQFNLSDHLCTVVRQRNPEFTLPDLSSYVELKPSYAGISGALTPPRSWLYANEEYIETLYGDREQQDTFSLGVSTTRSSGANSYIYQPLFGSGTVIQDSGKQATTADSAQVDETLTSYFTC